MLVATLLASVRAVPTLYAILGPDQGGPVAVGTISTRGSTRGQFKQLGANYSWAKTSEGVSAIDASNSLIYALVVNSTHGPPPPPSPFQPSSDCAPACVSSVCCRDPRAPPPGACFNVNNCSQVHGGTGSSVQWPLVLAAFSTTDGNLVREFPLPQLRTSTVDVTAGIFLALDLANSDALIVGRDIRDGADPLYKLFRVDLQSGHAATVGGHLPCMAHAEAANDPFVLDAAAGVFWVPLPHAVPGLPVPVSYLRGVNVTSGALLPHYFDLSYNSSSSLNSTNLMYDATRKRVVGLARDATGDRHTLFTFESTTGRVRTLGQVA